MVDGPEGDAALDQIRAALPDREVVGVPGAVLAYGGGGVHCITQQVPRWMAIELLTHVDQPLGLPGPGRRASPAAVPHRRRPAPLARRTRTSTGPRCAEGVTVAADAGRPAGVPAGADPLALLRRRPRTGPAAAGAAPEPLPGGPTHDLAAELAAEHGVFVHASLYEDAGDGGLGLQHRHLRRPRRRAGGPHPQAPPPGHRGLLRGPLLPARRRRLPRGRRGRRPVGFPTCWDQWFPELARAYSLAGAEVIVYPTAIGSEPDHPDFDTQPLWEKVIVGNGVANGTFMVAVNRIGTEPPLTFYGSSFISDPYGRILVQAPRDEPAVLVADLDLDERRDWLTLFPFLTTRRPDTYGPLDRA